MVWQVAPNSSRGHVQKAYLWRFTRGIKLFRNNDIMMARVSILG